MEKNLFKNCPECDCLIFFSRKDTLKKSIEENRLCRSCSKKGKNHPNFNKKLSEETLEKISKTWFRKGERPKNADERKNKTYEEIYGEEKAKIIKEKFNKRINSEESNNKRKITCKNSGCGLSNKGKTASIDTRLKISKTTKNKPKTKEHKTKIRLSSLRYLEKMLNLNGQKIVPKFNINACKIFDEISEQTKTNIQHALNGGEYYIKELGFWVDGYDFENNIVYEYDERHHFDINGNLKIKDVERQKLITELLNCKFIRIKYNDIKS